MQADVLLRSGKGGGGARTGPPQPAARAAHTSRMSANIIGLKAATPSLPTTLPPPNSTCPTISAPWTRSADGAASTGSLTDDVEVVAASAAEGAAARAAAGAAAGPAARACESPSYM